MVLKDESESGLVAAIAGVQNVLQGPGSLGVVLCSVVAFEG